MSIQKQQLPSRGDIVQIEYAVQQGGMQDTGRVSTTLKVIEVSEQYFIAGSDTFIGTKVTTTGRVYSPTNNQGFTSCDDDQILIGTDADWEIV